MDGTIRNRCVVWTAYKMGMKVVIRLCGPLSCNVESRPMDNSRTVVKEKKKKRKIREINFFQFQVYDRWYEIKMIDEIFFKFAKIDFFS